MAVKMPDGKLLYNDDTYSNSTSKHQSYVRGACRQYDFVHCATLEGAPYSVGSQSFNERNFKIWKSQIEWQMGKLGKARKPELYLAEVGRIMDKVTAFCKYFKVKLPKEFKPYVEMTHTEEVVAEAKKQAEKAAKAAARRLAKSMKEFMQFKTDYFNGNYQIVRLNTEKNRFETSLHVQIPFEIGREFWQKIMDGTLAAGDKVMWYPVWSVGSEIKVGCHTFKKKWLVDYGKKVFA